MRKNNYNIDLIAGIDTIEVKSETYVVKEYPFITYDATRRITKDNTEIPKYRYRFNPDNTMLDTSTFEGYQVYYSASSGRTPKPFTPHLFALCLHYNT